MSDQSNQETSDYLRRFTEQEERYLKILRENGIHLPERLRNWRVWVPSTSIYLNELKDLVDQFVLLGDEYTAVVVSEKMRKTALEAAHFVTCSPCEWTWTPEQQEAMARYCVWAAQRLGAIDHLAKGKPFPHHEKANT